MRNKIEPFKGRVLDPNKPIEVYRCLNRQGHIYSVRQNQKVVGHTDSICILDVAFVVNASGKQRAIASGQRNVHAFIRGMMSSEAKTASKPLRYCPFSQKGFMIDQEEVKFCNVVVIQPSGIFAA